MIGQTGVQITAKRRFGQFLILRPAKVEIDGTAVGDARWRQPTFFPTTSGAHDVSVGFPYVGKKTMGIGTVRIDVAPNQTVNLTYRSPWVVTMKGSIEIG